MKILKKISDIQYFGTYHIQSPETKEKIILTNRIAIIMFLTGFPYIFIFRSFGLELASVGVLPCLFIYSVIILLNKYNRINYARYLTFFGLSIIVVFFTLVLGLSSGAHLIFFPLSLLPLIILDREVTSMKYTCIAVAPVCSVITQMLSILFPQIFYVVLSPKVSAIIYLFATITTFSLIIPIVFAFYDSEQKTKVALYDVNMKLQKAFNDLKESKSIAENLSQQSAFATLTRGIAHEIKNPLHMMSGRAEYVLDHLDKQEAVKKFADVVIRNIERLKKLLHAMLTYGVSSGTEREAFSVNALLGDIVELAHFKCEEKKLDLSLEVADDFMVYANKDFIFQAILNLVVNAIQYTSAGGYIQISTEETSYLNKDCEERDGVKIAIQDTGIGIKETELEDIFIPYFTSKKESENIGLGLSMVYKTVVENDGVVEVDSTVGEGTTFYVYLPCVDKA